MGHMPSKVFLVVAALISVIGCAHEAPLQVAATAPNPSGCYVQVFEMNRFAGAFDYLNGPASYATLTTLPNGARWSKRIRSVRLGPIASAVAWRDTDFKGRSMQMASDRTYPVLAPGFDGEIQSLAIACSTVNFKAD